MSFSMNFKKIMAASVLAGASLTAMADITIDGGKLFVAENGEVTLTFLGSDAGYTDVLMFLGSSIFTGHLTDVGTVFDLGSFAAGTELTFQLHVNNTGNDFYTGPESANFDGVLHARAVLNGSKEAVVGFEDLQGGGDRDYNDLEFRVTNVSNVPAVPEASSLGMMLAGLGVMGWFGRRRKARPA